MNALDRKLLRDLRSLWSQTLTLSLVLAMGVAAFVATFSAYTSLAGARDRFYAESRFADVFASVKRAPHTVRAQIEALPGVAQVHTEVAQVARMALPSTRDPIMGLLVGVERGAPPQLNRVTVRSGRWPEPGTLPREALVSEAFAVARGLRPGDRLSALVEGRLEPLVISGIAVSPEYVFAGLGGSPDLRSFGVFWLDADALAGATQMRGAFNRVALRLAPGAREAPVLDALDRVLAPYGAQRSHGRSEQMSHRMLESEITEQRVLGTVLPVIFLAVSAFLLQVVLSRQIVRQREQIAALKALGYDNRTIALHYLKYAAVVVVLAVVAGTALGAVLGRWLTAQYGEVFRLAVLSYRLPTALPLVATVVASATALAATLLAIRSVVQLAPAEAMRPPAPGEYRRALVERMGLARFITPGWRMVLRRIEQRPLRALVTVAGVAAAMAVVVNGAFWRDSFDALIEDRFAVSLRGDVVASLIEAAPSPAVLAELTRLPEVHSAEGARVISVQLIHGHRRWRGALQGRSAGAQLQRITDGSTRIVEPAGEGLVLNTRLAQRLGVTTGDTLHVQVEEGAQPLWHLPVARLVDEPMGMGAYIDRSALNDLLREGDRINQAVLQVARGRDEAVVERMQALPRIGAAFSKTVMLRNIDSVTARNLLVFSAILTAFATVIAVGVVYNQARIALAERAWELASLRVLGFARHEVSGLLIGELALLVLVAIPVGLLAGRGLAGLVAALIHTDEFAFEAVVRPATHAYAALCVLLAAAASAWVVQRSVQRLDLVAVLKVRE
ncbi:MAG: ABC transporter permease [Burkholderiaceae bacterium]